MEKSVKSALVHGTIGHACQIYNDSANLPGTCDLSKCECARINSSLADTHAVSLLPSMSGSLTYQFIPPGQSSLNVISFVNVELI